jgi:hypothetical protein
MAANGSGEGVFLGLRVGLRGIGVDFASFRIP